jgi:DNA-binding LytR/AlgR family response regulator
MTKYTCLIVDDEPIARSIIETYCGHLPYLQVAGSCENAIEAKLFLQQQSIDILFLDINMPVMDGISLLKTLKTPPQVIFTTAYKEFAVDAFDLAAVDYLLKPFSFDRFLVAVDKAADKLKAREAPVVHRSEEKGEDFIFIRTDGKIYKIFHDDLLYAEASGNYTRIVTAQNIFTPPMTFSSVEEMLPASLFLRVHRSFIVNKSKITHIEGNRVFIGKNEIPIGSNYKESFFREIGFGRET